MLRIHKILRSVLASGAAVLVLSQGGSAQMAAIDSPAAPGLRSSLSISEPVLSRALVQHGIALPEVAAFYAARGGAPFWMAPDGAWARALLASLERADRHGLPRARYDPEGLRRRMAGPDPARAEAALMAAYLDFARHLTSGVVDPRSADREIHLPVAPLPVAALLARLSGPAPTDLEGLAPQDEEYRRLQAELERMRALARRMAALPEVPPGPTLRPGQVSDRVVALRERLAALAETGLMQPDGGITPAEGLIVPAPLGSARVYDSALAEAVRDFQARSGLVPDGIVGPATLAALNATAAERFGQVLVNLERIRWLRRDHSERHIFVNQADFTMEFMDGGRLVLDSRVIVGKPKFATPEFVDMMDHMVVNPTWHVPTSIATKEILPLLQRDPNYLVRNGYRLVPTGSEPVPDGVTSDFSQFSTRYFPFRIKQDPSERNALGRVKFMFPNQFSIYLHDTPTKSLFEKDQRTYSHGCVRVERPFELAYALLEGQVEDPRGYFDAILATGRERRINLARPVKVYLTYRTVFLDRQGSVQYRADVYGRDARVLARLAEAGVEVAIR
ncbi:MAG: murein L,D-transpeptidase [Paracoccaceae bacterium]|nr:MAG: murein L,D-transpeptidase [Paracoccaceae bacterium]